MRDTVWAGKPQRLMALQEMILQERGINTSTLKLSDMRIILSCHEDFRDAVLERRGHKVPKVPLN